MAGGFAPGGDDVHKFLRVFEDIKRRLAELELPTGTSVGSLVKQVQAALANINATVAAAIAVNSYTKTEIDSRIASPADGSAVTGNVSATGNVTAVGNVSADGEVASTLPLRSPGSRGYIVTTGFVGAWINGDGKIGYSPSSVRVKKDLIPFVGAARLLDLNVYRGRYIWNAADAQLQSFLIAEEVIEHFPDMVPCDIDGNPETVNYSQMIIPAIALLQEQARAITALTSRLNAAGL